MRADLMKYLVSATVLTVVIAVHGSARESGPSGGCPGSPPCNDRGACSSDNTCMCNVGFGGPDCGKETPMLMKILAVGPPELQDMKGLYKIDGMYMMEKSGLQKKDKSFKCIFYDSNSQGWGVSKMNSTCTDDMCLFGYSPGRSLMPPPGKGWTFGGSNVHIYYKQLVFDQGALDPKVRRGYQMNVAYTPDPTIRWPMPDYTEFNGKYILTPRYTHMDTGKYAIFPLDLSRTNRVWVAAGRVGIPRKWQILAETMDLTGRPYYPPITQWQPNIFQVVYACANHIEDSTCMQLADLCNPLLPPTADTSWVKQCCRSSCATCELSRFDCVLPKSNPLILAQALARVKKAKVTLDDMRKISKPSLRGGASLVMHATNLSRM